MIAALSLTACAQQQARPATSQVADANDSGPKKICRKDDRTGSIIPGRICLTPAQWAEIDGTNEQGTDRYLNEKENRHLGKVDE